MKNEYLFQSDVHRATVEACKPDGVAVEISGIDNTQLWVAAYSLANKNEESAKKLSDVHILAEDFTDHQIIIASIYNNYPFPNKNIIMLIDRLLPF